jgi:hypothetical protein
MKTSIKIGSTIFLQIIVVILGIGVLFFLLWEPHLEGRNINATLLEIYFKDPFLAYVYLGSIPFFMGVYQAFKLLGYVRNNTVFSRATVKALGTIKYCALITAGAIIAADTFLMIAARSNNEDAAGAVALGIVATLLSIIVATTAGMFERIVRGIVETKSENDLTA